MRRISLLLVIVILPALLGSLADAAPATTARREVEVCFVLDTTGSMSGLLESAKRKLWFIASEIASAPSQPRVRFCLIAFRDRGDEYVTRHIDLSDDLDAIHATLMALKADGGGDMPESVNQALAEAVDNTTWSTDPAVLKLVFLVGDAPPHLDYDEPQYPEISARAAARGIIINPVLCGDDRAAEAAFAQVAHATRGRAAQLTQPGKVRNTTTIMDQDIAVLSQRLDRSFIPYGSAADADATEAARDAGSGLSDSIASDRAAFVAARGRMRPDRIDLIEAIDAGQVDMSRLDPASLPLEFRSMTEAELHRHLGALRNDRAELRRLIAELLSERRQFLARRSDGDSEGFDRIVAETVRAQMQGVRPDPAHLGRSEQDLP